MISWMQRHKRWLVITIWISTIAFVGAGFVGWGSYDYGKKGGVVAVVADREVSVEEYQQEYSNLYEQYARLFGESFNKDMADKLNLNDVAYKQVLQKNLILAYGDTLGLDVTDIDIAKELVKYDAFLVNGKFDKPTYEKVLSQNRTTIKDFENSLKRNILLQKIQSLFDVQPNSIEVENLNKLLFAQDDISIKIIDSKNITLNPTDADLKEYWNKNKNAYMSEVEYVIESTDVPMASSNASDADIKSHYTKFKNDYRNADGKVKSLDEAKADIIKELDRKFTKKEALKKYLKVKKGEEKLAATTTYKASKVPFTQENTTKVLSSKIGELIKPVLEDDKYVIVKVSKKIDSMPLSFEDAKSQVIVGYMAVTKNLKLEEMAKAQLKEFKGSEIKNVSRESIDKIKGLEAQEAAKFLNELFSSTKKESFVKLNDKVVLYRINASKLGAYDKSKDESVKSTLVQLQDQELMSNLIKRLESSFEIQSSIDVKE